MNIIVVSIISIIIAYILGSFLPAFFIGKAKGFDIRKKGSGNPGTSNAAHVLGKGWAAIVALYDLFKAPVAIMIAKVLGASLPVALICGFVAIIGHLAPFYLKFKGGKGVATAVGIIGYCLALLLTKNWHFIYIFIAILVIMAIIWAAKHGKKCSNILSLIVLPLLIITSLLFYHIDAYTIAFFAACAYILAERTQCLLKAKLRKMPKADKKLLSRKLLRPFAIVFPIGLFFLPKWIVLLVIGIVFLFFVAMEIRRFAKPKSKGYLIGYRKTEKRRISSMTLFLLAAGLTILIFNKQIAALAILFLIFGDLAGWSIGKTAGKIKIFNKTLEGSLACFVTCAIISILFFEIFHLGLVIGLVGALVAALVELSPIQEDNLAIPLISAIVMTAIKAVLH